ncbi:MAG TPA: site-specific integrase [Terracidiphilus sp.]|jgi:integrase|nr:site-specific integrase [Terracidiphilus sp.]
MPRKVVRKERGVFEKVRGSDIWWIRLKVGGVEHREKVGRRGDAIKLYKIRKADILRGVKMPANMKDKGIKFSVIAQEAIDWYVNHDRRDVRNFQGRMKFILEAFADRVADEIKPSDIDTWIGSHKWSAATKNRYKNVFGKTFKIALADGKVTSNPARMVEQRPENNARIRFLSGDEETRLREAIRRRFPTHMPEFDVALHTGMRKSEQFSLEWSQVSLPRKRIRLEKTKNGSDREIPLNKTCLNVLEALHGSRPHNGRVFLSKYGRDLNNPRAWFEIALDEAKVKNFRWHDLRHTFISRLVMKDVNLRTVQELAGHKTISMTTRYAHLAPEHNQAAIEKLDSTAA